MTRLERIVALVLRIGATTSALCLGAGLLLSFADGDLFLARVLLHAGIVVLLATPVARVLVSMAQYFAERDWLFLTLTTVGFLELAASVVAALVFNQRL